MTAFTFTGGVYQILTVPSSIYSLATGINAAGLIVGVYEDLGGVLRGFANNGGTFSNVDSPAPVGLKPSASTMPDRSWQLIRRRRHRAWFRQHGGTFTTIDFPGNTTAAAGYERRGRHRRNMVGCNGIPELHAPGRRVHPDQHSARR